jgi:aminopeptidase YwaD
MPRDNETNWDGFPLTRIWRIFIKLPHVFLSNLFNQTITMLIKRISVCPLFVLLPARILFLLVLTGLFCMPLPLQASGPVNGTQASPAKSPGESFLANGPGESSLAFRLERHVSTLAADSMEGRGLGTEGKILAKRYIAEQFRLSGIKPLGDDFLQHLSLRVGVARVPATNVVGYLEGSDPVLKDEFIVIGAHYDHLGYNYQDGERILYPGADDNASGTAAVIELARHFAQDRDAIGRSIVFVAFDGEESGLLGARRFLEENGLIDPEKIKLMFSLDMVGMYEANRGVSLLGIGTLDGGRTVAERLARQQGLSIRRTTRETPGRTDSEPFGRLGIPSVHVFTGLKSPYHKPEDTFDLLDYAGMARITVFLKALVSEFSLLPSLEPSRYFASLKNPRGVRFETGLLAILGGTSHVFPDEYYSANFAFAFGAGLFLEMQVGRKISIQPEVLYDFNASKAIAGTYRRHSITVPVNLNYNLVGGPGEFGRFYPFAGGYYRHSFAGNDGEFDLDFENLHPAGEWGLNFGIGLEVMGIRLAYTFRTGLSDISAAPERITRTRGHYMTMGWRL